MPLTPGPQIPPQPQAPRELTTACEVLAWVVGQDTTGVPDPVSVPSGVVGWIAMVFQQRAKRSWN